MALYEHVFLVRQDATPQQVEALSEQLKAIIEAGGGKISKVESWGLRAISFRMNKNRKAHYTLMNIDAPWAAVAEMERQMKINEDVLRFMTIRVEALEEGPSAVMQRKDRDDRFERDGRDGGNDRGGERGRGFRRRDEATADTEEEVAV